MSVSEYLVAQRLMSPQTQEGQDFQAAADETGLDVGGTRRQLSE